MVIQEMNLSLYGRWNLTCLPCALISMVHIIISWSINPFSASQRDKSTD